MSKNRGQSMERALSRAEVGRGSHYVTITEGKKIIAKPVYKKPRIVVEFIDTFGKLFIFKRPSCGNNRKRSRLVKQKPYYNIVGQI